MDPKSFETYDRREQLFQPGAALRWLSYAGNDERKLLLYLALVDSGEALGQSALNNKIEALSNFYFISKNDGPFGFCEASLSKIGAVVPEDTVWMSFGKNLTTVKGFRAAPNTFEFGIPFAGALLKWSFEHPDLSLNFLGRSNSPRDAKAPLIRYWALHDLISTADDSASPSIVHLTKYLPISNSTRQGMVNRFVQLGLATKESSHFDNLRRFKIIQPQYVEAAGRPRFEKLKPTSQMLWRAIGEGYTHKDIWGIDEFLRFMTEKNPEADADLILKVKKSFESILKRRTTSPYGVIEYADAKLYDEHSKVTLRPEVVDAIKNLVSIIDGFCVGDTTIINKGKAAAIEILSSPRTFGALYTKAAENSTQTIHDERFEQHLIDLVQSAGEIMTAQAIQEAYSDETGRKISISTIRRSLGKLVVEGKLEVNRQPGSKLKKRAVLHYGPPQQQ